MYLLSGILSLIIGIIAFKQAFDDYGKEWLMFIGIPMCMAGVILIIIGLSPLLNFVK